MFSAVHPTKDIAKILRHVRFVAQPAICVAAGRPSCRLKVRAVLLVEFVTARSDSDEAIHTCLAESWIASRSLVIGPRFAKRVELRTPLRPWQRELKSRAPSRVGARPQPAAMRFDDPPTDRQSHTGTLRLVGEECLENALAFVDGKPGARIAYRNQQLTILAPLRCDGHFTTGVLHRLDAVEHEVHQNLLQLHAIGCGRRQADVEPGPD